MPEKKWYTRQEAAVELGVCIRTFDSYLTKKEIPHYKYGKHKGSVVRIKVADINEFIEKSLVA